MIQTGIYAIENLVNHKIYVGQSVNIDQRWRQHRSSLRHNHHENQHLQNAWNTYGESSFEFKILELCSTEELDLKEEKWAYHYKSFLPDKGYNKTLDGGNARRYTPILQFDLSGNFIKEWDCPLMAAQELNISVATIYGCCLKRYKNAGNYIWVYKEDYLSTQNLDYYLTNQVHKNVCQYDRTGKLVKVWTTPAEVQKELGLNVASCCLHYNLTCGGYIFKYANDPLVVDREYAEYAFSALNRANSRPFYQVDKSGQIVGSFMCIREAEQQGYNEKMISDCCRGLIKTYKGYIWIYQDQFHTLTEERIKALFTPAEKHRYKILQYTMDNKFIKQYPYLEATKQDGFLPANVAMCCKGRKPQYKGYIWKYGEEI